MFKRIIVTVMLVLLAALVSASVSSADPFTQLVPGQTFHVSLPDQDTGKSFTNFEFTPSQTAGYIWYSTSSVDTYGEIYDDQWDQQIACDEDSGEDRNFRLSCVLNAGQTYYFGTLSRGGIPAQYDVILMENPGLAGAEADQMIQYIAAGASATLNVNVFAPSGTQLTYEWYEGWGDTLLTTTTTGSYTIAPVNQMSVFQCVVSDTFGTSLTVMFYVWIDDHFYVSVPGAKRIEWDEGFPFQHEKNIAVDKDAHQPATVDLQVEASCDPDGLPLHFTWDLVVFDENGDICYEQNNLSSTQTTQGTETISTLTADTVIPDCEGLIRYSCYVTDQYENNSWNEFYIRDRTDSMVEGYCGPDTCYSLTWGGVLNITGTGEVTDCDWGDPQSVKEVVIWSGVTSLPDFAFLDSPMTSIALPDTLTAIGRNAFSGCTALTNVFFEGTAAQWNAVTIAEGNESLTNQRIIIGSGMWGDLSWKLDTAGLLTVDGSGPMNDFSFNVQNYPSDAWLAHNTEITAVILSDGITSIGTAAFVDCGSLTDVTIPASVSAIGSNAFMKCGALTGVTIPSGVTRLRDSVFAECTSLTSVSIPDSVTSIENRAFDSCGSLTSLRIPDGLTSVVISAFYSCDIKLYASLDSSAAKALSKTGYAFYPIGETYGLQYVYTGNTITGLALAATDKAITSFTIPQTVTAIGDRAFSGCTGLTSISIPDNVTAIGKDAFFGCTGLTNVSITDNVTSIGSSAFCGCAALTGITLPENLTAIGDNAFNGCAALTGVSIPSGVSVISDGLFSGCASLETVSLPAGITAIGDNAFNQCGALTDVYYSGYLAGWNAITMGNNNENLTNATLHCTVDSGMWGSLFWKLDTTGLLTITGNGPMNDLSSNNAWLAYKTDIMTVEIADGITSIGSSAFENCSNMTSVNIPDTVAGIGDYAFDSCSVLGNILLPEHLSSIGNYTFYWCSGMTEFMLPDNITSIGPFAFLSCRATRFANLGSVTSKTLSKNGWSFKPVGQNYFLRYEFTEDEITGLAFVSADVDATSVIIPQGVTSIDSSAFQNRTSLTEVTMPVGVTSIGNNAFYGCSSLTSISIPDGVISIGNNAFHSCENLVNVSLPNSLTSIGESAFYACGSLNAITIPDSVTMVGNNAFANVPVYHLAHVDTAGAWAMGKAGYAIMPVGETFSVQYIFDGDVVTDVSLTSVSYDDVSFTVPDYVTLIGEHTFSGHRSLKSITFPDNVSGFDRYSFDGCGQVTKYANLGSETAKTLSMIGYGFTPIGQENYSLIYRFTDDVVTSLALATVNYQVTNFTIPTGVTEICSFAFSGCSELSEIVLPDDIDTVGSSAFINCSAVRYAAIDSEAAKALGRAFYSFNPLGETYSLKYTFTDDVVTDLMLVSVDETVTEFTVPEGVTLIGQGSLTHSGLMTSVIIPDSVTTIGNEAFRYCTSLTSINLPQNITSIGKFAFENCSNLASVTLPTHLTSIEDYTFQYCNSLTSLTIPDSVTYIGAVALPYSTSLYAQLNTDGAKAVSRYGRSFRVPGNKYDLKYVYTDDTITGLEIKNADKDITSISIPGGVTIIGDSAFHSCSSLTSVSIPEGVTSIGESAFYKCSSLESVTIPEGVTSIGGSAFSGCSSLTEITIPDSVDSIGLHSFGVPSTVNKIKIYCSDLTADIAKTLSKAGYSFWLTGQEYSLKYEYDQDTVTGLVVTSALETITEAILPEGVTGINEYAFMSTTLSSITLPGTLTSIGSQVFNSCNHLASIVIPEGLLTIGTYTFSSPTILFTDRNTVAAQTLSKAGYSFREPGCGYDLIYLYENDIVSGLEIRKVDEAESFVIPDYVTSIGECAFQYQTNLTRVTIPVGVKSIGYQAFTNCNNLRNVTLPNTITDISSYAFMYCKNLTEVTIPANVTNIGNCAFEGCSQLSRIMLLNNGETISIGSNAFASTSLTTVYCYEYTDADSWATDNGYTVIYLDNYDPDSERTVTLSETVLRLPLGETRAVDAAVFPDYDQPVLTWTSSDTNVVTVNDGLIEAVGAGTATVTVAVGMVSAVIDVTVFVPATGISFAETELWTVAKEALSLSPVLTPDGADAMITWSTSDTSIAIISETGAATTKKPGDVTVTATTDTGLSCDMLLHVCYPVTAIAFENDAIATRATKTVQLTANVTMRTQSCVNRLITFTSSDETVVTVDASGFLKAIGVGQATVTATSASGVTATCSVTVTAANRLVIPAGTTTIESEAFANLPFVDIVEMCNHVTSIADDAFSGSDITISAPSGSYAETWALAHGVPFIVQ